MARLPSPVVLLAATLATMRPERAPGGHAKDAEELARIGRRLKRLALERCNGVQRWHAGERRMVADFTDADQARHDRARAKMAARAAEILAPYGVDPTTVEADRDPRGNGLAWRFPGDPPSRNGFSDDWSI